MEKQKSEKSLVKKTVNIFLGILFLFLSAYLLLGFWFDPSFLARDAGEKYGRVLGATTLSLRVIGPPGKPTLSAEARCSYLGAPFVRLSWGPTSDTDYYDLVRDANPLINGITENSYDDYAVTAETNYSYLLTAFGPVGQTDSDPAVITTNFCNALPDPFCQITQLNNTPVVDPAAILQTEDRTPTFRGSTNIMSAIVEIEVESNTPIFSETHANANGFWEWTVPTELAFGSHLLTVTSIDPLAPSRRHMSTLAFEVVRPAPTESNNDKDDEEDDNGHKKSSAASAPSSSTRSEISFPFSLALQVSNPDAIVYSGQELKTRLIVTAQDDLLLKNQTLKYSVADANGNVVYQFKTEKNLSGGAVIDQSLTLPRLLKNGRYKVIVETKSAGLTISAENYFQLQEAPLVVAGPVRLTLTELTQNLGWAIAILFLLLLIFLLLLSVEYWLYKHSKIHINEDLLERQGFLGKRKEVAR